jgi:putative phosphoesterase
LGEEFLVPLTEKKELNARIWPYIKIFAVLLTGFIGAMLAVWLFGASTVEVEGIEFKVGLAPGRSGLTEVHFPPFGVIEARTHQGPVKLIINLEQISSDSFKAHMDNPPDQKKFVQQLQDTARDRIAAFALHQTAVALLGAFLLVLLVWRPGMVKLLLYPAISTLVLLLILSGIFRSYDIKAFHEPEYKGVLSMAPTAVKFATDSLADLQQIRNHTRQIVSNLGVLFSSADSLMAMADPEEQGEVVKVLLVSDLHSNPVGVELTKSLATRFGVDFLINAGDLTDMGSKLEASFTEDLAAVGVPQLFVGGNHDSPEIMDFMAEIPESHILDGDMVTVKGIKVLGFSHPLAAVPEVEYSSQEEEEEALGQQVTRVYETVAAQGRPDILVVHDSKLGKKLVKLAGLVIAGHDHRLRIEQGAGWVFVNPGTTGASGLRGFYSEKGISYSASIAYMLPDYGVLAVDMVKYNPVSKQFSLERKLLNPRPNAAEEHKDKE